MSTITLSNAYSSLGDSSGQLDRPVTRAEVSARGRVGTESTRTPVGPRPRTERGRPSRRSGRAPGPSTRPSTGVSAPQLRRSLPAAVSSCEVTIPVAPLRPATRRVTRLTDRGIALVIVAGVMVAVAALTVVGATAARVTSDHYQATSLVNR